ncbi:hypothetical protein, partial [Borreliella burgdorferi]
MVLNHLTKIFKGFKA